MKPMPSPNRDDRPAGAPRGAGMSDYLKEAFLFRWNLLFFLGGTAAAALTPLAPVLLPLVAAGELTYLTGLVSVPRFRAAIDAKVDAEAVEGLQLKGFSHALTAYAVSTLREGRSASGRRR